VEAKIDLKALDEDETERWALSQGLKSYRARQIRHWIFGKCAESFDAMTDLPKSVRTVLKETTALDRLKHVETRTAQDGCRKFLFVSTDGLLIESVLIPQRSHMTLCISSQAGCNMDCRFCMTARGGLQRNLSASEIVEQIVQIRRRIPEDSHLTNVVFMGMGEPLANYSQVVKAIRNMTSHTGMNLSHRKLTLSTCGLVPQMERLGRDVTVNLAVSLNATDNRTRNFLMPINRKYPIETLLGACRRFPLPNRRRITFEYVLIKDVNDSDADAARLVALLSGIKAKVNLIPLNPFPGLDMEKPASERVQGFHKILVDRHITAIVRDSKGGDILGGCGQLSGTRSGLKTAGSEGELPCKD